MKPSLIVHAGRGTSPIPRLNTAGTVAGAPLKRAWQILSRGGAALDAVEAAIVVLKDDPTFHAGLGSHLNRDGRVQLDAIIMNGETLL